MRWESEKKIIIVIGVVLVIALGVLGYLYLNKEKILILMVRNLLKSILVLPRIMSLFTEVLKR